MTITVREAMDRVLTRVSLAGGVDTNTYSETVLLEMLNNKINLLFDKYWWPQYYNPGEVFTLDGTQGLVVDDLSSKIKRFQDIRHVWIGSESSPIPRASYGVNPASIKARCFLPVADPTKVIRIFPLDTTDTITIAYRQRPNRLVEESDKILLDDELIIVGTAYDYVNGLGINPAEEAKLAAMFEDRLETLLPTINAHDISLSSVSHSSIPMGWYEVN